MKKIKKAAKIEKVFGNSSEEERVFQEKASDDSEAYDVLAEYEKEEDIEPQETESDSTLTKKQIQKQNEIETVKSKISKILKSSNIEIVDENFGDEYESEDGDDQMQSQQDYDTLKAMFGDKDRNKKDELTLTIDDFDYTYVGKYIEEFDLMHLKNIKHIRLKNPNAKKIKKALIAAGLVIVLGLGGVLAYFLTKQSPVVMTSVALSQSSSTSNYFVGENFNYDGLYINVKYSDGTTKKVKVTNEHFDHTEGGGVEIIGENFQFLGGNVLLVLNYEGYELNYNIEVKSRELHGIDAKFADGIFNLQEGQYISGYINGKDDLVVLFNYGEYGFSKSGSYSNLTLKVDGTAMPYESGKGWRMTQTTEGKTITLQYSNGSQVFNLTLQK